MPTAHRDTEFVAYVLELMSPIGPVYAKRMFGAHGLFLDGIMFALISKGALYFKTDEDTQAEYAARGLSAFCYTAHNRIVRLSYHQAPEEALESDADMVALANKAYRTALEARARN